MSIPQNIPELIRELTTFSHNKLKNQDDISILLEISHSDNKKQLLNDLIFTAKYLNGLGKILHTGPQKLSDLAKGKDAKSSIQQDSLVKVKKEYQTNLEKFIKLLTEMVEHKNEDKYEPFKQKYFKLTQESMVNLTTLIYDLCWLKKYTNEKNKSEC